MAGEFRFDPMTHKWVSIVGHRQARPNVPTGTANVGCPFCVGGLEAPAPYDVMWFTNRWPAFDPGEPAELAAPTDLGHSTRPAVGTAEVILFSSNHEASLGSLNPEEIRKVIDLWAERTSNLMLRPEIEYVLVFENRGAEVGATIAHPHGQIYAFGHVPPTPAHEASISREHGCTVCADLTAELSDGRRIVHDSDTWTAYVPFASEFPYGLRVVAKQHTASFVSLSTEQRDGLGAVLIDVLSRYDRLWLDDPQRSAAFPYLLWFHQAPKNHHGEYHIHAHIAPPQRGPGNARFVAAGELGSGTYSNPIVPESAATTLLGA